MDYHPFVKNLLYWHLVQNDRDLPWKGEADPYKIWLSEIILQQTRAEQGLKYYQKFIGHFPDVSALARASESKVFKLWEGLGYYSRCKNMHATAKRIDKEFAGIFPSQYNQIISLKGIGAYTAAAIASFAFQLPYAVVDGNVKRVLSRVFQIELFIDSTEGKKTIEALAQQLLPIEKSAEYNQAIMDFGATVCKPFKPACSICPLKDDCLAYQKGIVQLLPQKSKSVKIKNRFFNYFIIEHQNHTYIRKRTSKDIWQGLHEPVLIESDHLLSPEEILRIEEMEQFFISGVFQIEKISDPEYQKLTHQKISAQFIHVISQKKLTQILKAKPKKDNQITKLAFPKIVASYLKEKSQTLDLTLA